MFGNNPFNEYRATQQQVQEAVEYPHMMYDPKTGKEVKAKTPADHAKYSKMGYTHDKPKMDEGTQYVIPEEIPANERTAFHGAAAAAAKAGKSHFNFGGKKHPVTMKKDTAKAITSDTQKEGAMKDLATNKTEPNPKSDEKVVADFKKRRKMKKDDKSEVNMNPKVDNEKADKGSAMETKESTIREKLIAVLEGDRAKHYKGATKPETMDDKLSGKGAKDMMNQPKETDDTVKKSHDDASKAGKTGKTAKQRGGGDMVRSGDQKIVPGGTPMKGMKGTMEAYTSMYEKEETDGN